MYGFHASYLMPLVVTLSVCLARWLAAQTANEVDATWEVFGQLEQPFGPLLPTRLPHNKYRRITSNCMVTARVQDLTSSTDSETVSLDIE